MPYFVNWQCGLFCTCPGLRFQGDDRDGRIPMRRCSRLSVGRFQGGWGIAIYSCFVKKHLRRFFASVPGCTREKRERPAAACGLSQFWFASPWARFHRHRARPEVRPRCGFAVVAQSGKSPYSPPQKKLQNSPRLMGSRGTVGFLTRRFSPTPAPDALRSCHVFCLGVRNSKTPTPPKTHRGL